MKNFIKTIQSIFSADTIINETVQPTYASFVRKGTAVYFTRSERLELGLTNDLFNVAFTTRVGNNVFISFDALTEDGSKSNFARKFPADRKLSVLS